MEKQQSNNSKEEERLRQKNGTSRKGNCLVSSKAQRQRIAEKRLQSFGLLSGGDFDSSMQEEMKQKRLYYYNQYNISIEESTLDILYKRIRTNTLFFLYMDVYIDDDLSRK